MASRKGTLTYSLVLDTKQFDAGGKRAKATFLGLRGEAAKFAKLATAGFGAIAGIAALKQLAQTVIVNNIEFERLTTQIRTLTVGGEQDIKRFNDALVSMASATATGPAELAKALFFVESAGIRGAAAMETTRVSAQAAAAGLGDSATVARTVTAAMVAYSAEHLTATDTVDKLIEIVRQGGAQADEYAGALGRVLPVASALGVNLDEVGAFMAVFTRTGVSAAEASTSLRSALLALGTPTESAAKAMDEFGFSADEIKRSLREDGLNATLQRLRLVLNDDLDALKKVIPSVEALAGVFAVTGDQAGAYRVAVEASATATGNLADVTEQTANTVAFQWDRLVAVIEARTTTSDSFIGEFVQLSLKNFTDFVAGADLMTLGMIGLFGGFAKDVEEWTDRLHSVQQVINEIVLDIPDALPALDGGFGLAAPVLELASATEQAKILAKGLADELKGVTKEVEKQGKAYEKTLAAAETYIGSTTQALEQELMAAWEQHLETLGEVENALLAISSEEEHRLDRLNALDQAEQAHTDNVMAGEEATAAAAKAAEEAEKATVDWHQVLEDVANQFTVLGDTAGAVLSGITAGIAGIGAGLDTFKAGQKQGGFGGLLGQISGGLAIAGAAVGIGQAIIGLFKSDPVEKAAEQAGAALGFTVSDEMAEGFLRTAEQTGQTISEVAKEWFDDVRAELRQQGMDLALAGVQAQADALGGAPQFAEIAARNFNTVFWEHVKDKGLPAALEAFGGIFEQLRGAFGDELPPGFQRLEALFEAIKDPATAAALQFLQGQADIVSGSTLGGFFDPQMTQDSIQIARETLALLERQGVSAGDANRLVAGLLQAELDAAIVSGQGIDEGLQQLLDEAKENGVQVLPSIATAQLDVLRQIFRAVSGRNATVPGAPGGGAPAPGPGGGGGGGGAPSPVNEEGFDPTSPSASAMASGGIVTRPTRALIGEAGPEAVIPLGMFSQLVPEMQALRAELPRAVARAVRDGVMLARGG